MKLGPYAIEQDYSHYVADASEIIFAVVGTATKGPIGVPTLCTSPTDLINKFGNLNPNCLGLYASLYFLNQSNKLWYVRAAKNTAVAPTVTIAGSAEGATSVADAMLLTSKNIGTANNGFKVTIDEVDTITNTFTLIVKNADTTPLVLETISNISMEDLGATSFTSAYVTFTSKNPSAISLTEGDYTLSGGDDGIEGIESADFINAADSLVSDVVDMNLFAVPGVSDPAVVSAMLILAENRGDCLYLVDPPNVNNTSAVKDYHNGTGDYQHTLFNSSYGAIYFSWQKIYDSYNRQNIEIPPSAVVAPMIASSQKQSEIWYAPAGLQRGIIKGVIEPVYTPTAGEVQDLYTGSNNVNCIINDPQVGLCVFGQKTLSRIDSALDRVNVRLLLNYLKRIIVAACKTLTFEPNDRITWNNFEDLIEPTLKNIVRLRGLYDYQISSIITDSDIDNYRMPCRILIKPTKSAEEIPIYFTITNTGAVFNEVFEEDGLLSI